MKFTCQTGDDAVRCVPGGTIWFVFVWICLLVRNYNVHVTVQPQDIPVRVGARRLARSPRSTAGLWSGSTDRWSLAAQIFFVVVSMLVIVVVPVDWLSLRAAETGARNEAIARARSTAIALAGSPWVAEAVMSDDPSGALRRPVEQIRIDGNLSFIVIMSTSGVRWTHPDPDQLGRIYIGSIAEAVAGGIVIEEYVGTLGRSIRVVVPVHIGEEVVGLVAAGVLMESVNRIANERSIQFAGFGLASLVIGIVGIWLITRRVHRQTHGLSPLGLGRLHSYHEAILHSVRAGVVLVGREGTVVLCNDEASTLLDAPGVHPGSSVVELGLEPDLVELMTSGRRCSGETYVAGPRALVVTQVPAMLDGVNLGWVTTLHDRTDLVRVTGELDCLRSFSDMLRSRAHEADNRLHAVIMLVEMGRPDEAVKLATATIEQSQALVDTVTRAVRDAPLAALLLGKSAQAEERGVCLKLAQNLDVPTTGIASGDILVVLGNLIDNAIDAAAGASEPRWVGVDGGVHHLNGVVMVRFEVSDSGPGVPPNLVTSVFQRGWSTKPYDGRPHGRGLGLSLAAGTVHRLQGTIRVDQNPSRFEVHLPLPTPIEQEEI